MLKSRRNRVVKAAIVIVFLLGALFFVPRSSFNFDVLHDYPTTYAGNNIDWSRYAYTQYVTDTEYLCNSVMLFEILHRLGSQADRLMMYPAHFQGKGPESTEGRLLLKAKNEYGVKLMPIQIQHKIGDATWADSYTKLLAFNQTQYERVVNLDSDSTILQHMDELFFLPPCPVAMPRAYWIKQPYFGSHVILIQPSVQEFERIDNAIKSANRGDYDMEIVNDLYGEDCMILPHQRYGLLTNEFRSKNHRKYMGNKTWDPEMVLKEAKYIHFSDWPMPKPWYSAKKSVVDDMKPKCDLDSIDWEDCRARDIWLGFYNDFKERKEKVCGPETDEAASRNGKPKLLGVQPKWQEGKDEMMI